MTIIKFPSIDKRTITVTEDVFDILVQQSYPNPIIYDLYWVLQLLQENRRDVVGFDTWFEDDDDNICYFDLHLRHKAKVTIVCEGVESTEHTPRKNVTHFPTRYVPKKNSCYESVKLQISLSKFPVTWEEHGHSCFFTFPENNTQIAVHYSVAR